MNLVNLFVVLDPKIQELIALGVTALVSFLLLQLAALFPALAAYLGQYKVGIITFLTGVVVQLVQAQLDKIPATYDSIVLIVMQLIIEVAIVLLGFSLYRKKQLKGHTALLPS